jgi:protein-disulfide isomerase
MRQGPNGLIQERITLRLLSALLLFASMVLCAGGPRTRELGDKNAPLRIDLFSDFTCKYCKTFHEKTLPRIIAEYVDSGKAYLVFHEFPLSGKGHEYSKQSAACAAAAVRIGKYGQIADALFASQATWSEDGRVLEAIAAVLSPDEQKTVAALISDETILNEIQQDFTAARAMQVDRTPTAVVSRKGKTVKWADWSSYELFTGLLNDLLSN